MKEKIVLIGGGGHCKVIIDAVKKSGQFEIYGIVDPGLKKGASLMGCLVLGNDDVLPSLPAKGIRNAFIAVGSTGNCEARKRLYKNLKEIGLNIPSVCHPEAIIAEGVELGEGAFVAACAVINSGSVIGKNAIINTSASVDHDCIIGDYAHIAPGVTLSGGVKVGSETHIGTGANVIQCLTIGKKCLVGAGATVRHNMEDGKKSFGTHISDTNEK